MAVALVTFASIASAQPLPTSDPRIQSLIYDTSRVVTLDVAPGYAAVIELAPDEAIDNLVIGNAGAWQVTEARSGDQVVVKPLPGAVPTDLVVRTDQRRYVFLLEPATGSQSSFVVRFSYPPPTTIGRAAPPTATYKLSGDRGLFPLAMYDDGTKTIVTWAKQTPLPAVFAMNAGQEAAVNGRMVGNNYVIEGIASRYVLRFGDAEAVAARRPERRR